MFGIVQYSGRYKEGPEGPDFLPPPPSSSNAPIRPEKNNNMFSNLMTTYFGAENWYHWIEISYNGISCFIPHKILCSFEESLRLLAD